MACEDLVKMFTIGSSLLLLASAAWPQEAPFHCETSQAQGPMIQPWQSFRPDPAFHGQWLVAGDLDGEGQAEIVTARHQDQAVTAILASRLDGKPLWRWGEAHAGTQGLYCDVPVHLYDLNEDGKDEVFVGAPGFLLMLEGSTGKEIKRWPNPDGIRVVDCVTFADLRGLGRAQDMLLKDRYSRIWAYTTEGDLLWYWHPQQGMICHHPTVVDLDHDGKDEVLAGYHLLDHDGKELWAVQPKKADLAKGHLDCSEVMALGATLQEARFLLTYCGANALALVDGSGQTLWELNDQHFESVDAGPIVPGLPGKQIVVDIDHRPFGQGLLWLLDDQGKLLGSFTCGYGRHHRLVDWDGDGFMEILIGNAERLFNGRGECVAHFGQGDAFASETGEQQGNDPGPFIVAGDLDGDQRPEIILHSPTTVQIYKSEKAAKLPPGPLGAGVNFSLY